MDSQTATSGKSEIDRFELIKLIVLTILIIVQFVIIVELRSNYSKNFLDSLRASSSGESAQGEI